MPLPLAYQQLISAFDQLPGIGPLAAERLVQYTLNSGHIRVLRDALSQAELELQQCECCQSYSVSPVCTRCQDAERATHGLLVLASITHQQQAEAAGFAGHFFVLHGLLSPMIGLGPKQLKLDKLHRLMVQRRVTSVTVALDNSAEGRATRQFIQTLINSLDVPLVNTPWEDWLAQSQA